jgi:DNA-binding transcriptional LysR family regulator
MQLGTSLMVKVGRRVALSEAEERYFASIRDQIEGITEATGAQHRPFPINGCCHVSAL